MAPIHRTDDVAEVVALGVSSALNRLLADIRQFVPTLLPDAAPAPDVADRLLPSLLNRGDRLTAELLAYAGRQELEPAAIEPLLLLLRSMADLLRRTLDERIEVAVEVERGCAACYADARALDDALLSLVVNARDAMPDGGRLGLSAQEGRLPDDSPAVALSVSDSGVGMTADVTQRAALPFFTTKTNAPWAGMGLSAVYGFVRQSGGSMTVRSSSNAGTTVTLYLPQHRAEAQTGPKHPS